MDQLLHVTHVSPAPFYFQVMPLLLIITDKWLQEGAFRLSLLPKCNLLATFLFNIYTLISDWWTLYIKSKH